MIQFTRMDDPRAISANRDCAHYGMRMLQRVMDSLTEERLEPWLKDYLKKSGVTLEQVGEAAKVVAALMVALYDTSFTDKTVRDGAAYRDAMAAVGFDTLPPAAFAVIYQRIGERQLAAIWYGRRDVTNIDAAPPIEVEQLVNSGAEAKRFLLLPRWRRGLFKAWRGVKRWLLRKLTGGKSGPNQPTTPAVPGAAAAPPASPGIQVPGSPHDGG